MARLPATSFLAVSITSVQAGSAVGKGLFSSVTPLTAAWLRLATAALILLPMARPWRAFPRRGDRDARARWTLLALFAVGLCSMNMSIYLAFERIPIGLAVTLEFLGPLGVAAAGSRRFRDLGCVLLAGLGVALLGFSPVQPDPWGIVCALIAAAAWALYIVAGARMGGAWRGVDALACSCAAGALALTPCVVALAPTELARPHVLLTGAAVGLLSTVVPYTLELAALDRIPKATFGILMSLEPAAAALAGLLILHERLTSLQLIAMACVVTASVWSSWSSRRRALRAPVPD